MSSSPDLEAAKERLKAVQARYRVARMGDRAASKTFRHHRWGCENGFTAPAIATIEDAKSFARCVLRDLLDADFSHICPQERGGQLLDYDVYGVKNDAGVWYVKFKLTATELRIDSCHCPKYPLTFPSGKASLVAPEGFEDDEDEDG